MEIPGKQKIAEQSLELQTNVCQFEELVRGAGHNVMYAVCYFSNPFLKNNRRGCSAAAKAPLIGMNTHRRFSDDIHLRASPPTNADGLIDGIPFFRAVPSRAICNNHEDKLAICRGFDFGHTLYHCTEEMFVALLGRAIKALNFIGVQWRFGKYYDAFAATDC